MICSSKFKRILTNNRKDCQSVNVLLASAVKSGRRSLVSSYQKGLRLIIHENARKSLDSSTK